eukprot:jgi/Botrbrau1/10606/Bobra.0358s0025.1
MCAPTTIFVRVMRFLLSHVTAIAFTCSQHRSPPDGGDTISMLPHPPRFPCISLLHLPYLSPS